MYDDESRMWNRSREFQEVLNDSGFLCEDRKLADYVNNVLDKLVFEIEERQDIDLRAYIIKDPLFNAFCLPDGVIYIHTGLLATIDNEAQLATLLGHEVSHFLYRHSLRQKRSVTNKSAFFTFVNMSLGAVAGEIGGTAANLAMLFSKFAIESSVYGYQRGLERDADENAFNMMRKAGYNPLETKKMMENLAEAVKDEKQIPYFYSSHPRTKERIKTYDSLIEKLKSEEMEIGGRINSKAYNAMTNDILLDTAELSMKRKAGLKTARTQIEKYIGSLPGDYRAQCLLGKLCVLEGDLEQAKKAFNNSINLNPNYADSYKELGFLYYKEGKKDLSDVKFATYLELAPKAKDVGYIRRYIND